MIGAGRLRAGEEQASQETKPGAANQEQKNLQLEVFINDIPANTIGSFVLFGGNRIGATRNELEEIGLRIGARRFPQDIVMLDDIPVKYQYDERTQKIRITVDNADRQGRAFDLSGDAAGRFAPAQSGWGALLNYDLLSTTGSLRNLRSLSFSGTSLALESRTFSPYGTFEQSGLVRFAPQGPSEFIRLGTTFRYSDQERMITYRAGDAISGGLAWSRPVRIGGVQSQSNFALRPDLITAPLPTLGGTAAVPSTVDVYVNSIKTFSQDIGPGPFSLNNVPLVSGAGNAQLVIRDSSGHETKTTVPFYASSILLAPGLSSWSIEAGLPRLSFGSTSDAYVQSPVGSATLRRGIFDWLTVEAHAEGGAGTANGGVGAVFKTGTFGVASAAVSGSTSEGNTGFQTYVSYETQVRGLNVNASSQRTFGTYDDLASATARLQDAANPLQTISGLSNYVPSDYLSYLAPKAIPIYLNARTPRALDRITVSAPLWFDIKSSVSASFLHMVDAAGRALRHPDRVLVTFAAAQRVDLRDRISGFRNQPQHRGVRRPLDSAQRAGLGLVGRIARAGRHRHTTPRSSSRSDRSPAAMAGACAIRRARRRIARRRRPTGRATGPCRWAPARIATTAAGCWSCAVRSPRWAAACSCRTGSTTASRWSRRARPAWKCGMTIAPSA